MLFTTWFKRFIAVACFALASTGVHAEYVKGRAAIARGDYAAAGAEFEAAAKTGNREAMAALGSMFAEGLGVERDYNRALEWYLKAAEAGHVAAQSVAARMYATGTGVAKSDAQSLFWARRAADAGDAGAQYIMGVRSAQGVGVKRDSGQALLWFGAAAEQGYGEAQYSLGFLMAQGAAALKDPIQAQEFRRQAYKWLLIAKRSGNMVADVGIAKLKTLLTPEEIAKVEIDAAAWKPAGAPADSGQIREKP